MEGAAIVALRRSHDRELEGVDQGIVLVDEGHVDLDALLRARVGEVLDHRPRDSPGRPDAARMPAGARVF